MFSGLFKKKGGGHESSTEATKKSVFSVESAVPSRVDPVSLERRRILQGILGTAGLSALGGLTEACTTYENYTMRFTNNFDYCPDQQFTEQDLETANNRNHVKMTAEDCRWVFQKALDEMMAPQQIDLDDVYYLHDQDGLVTASNEILGEDSQKALMKKYPFIKSITAVKSSTFPCNYEFKTEYGYLYFSMNKSRLVVNDFGRQWGIGMLYNTSDPYVQTSPEYRDYQRTVTIYGRDEDQQKYQRELTCETGHGVLENQGMMVQAFSSAKVSRDHIYETQTFTSFLRNAQSTPVIDSFLKNVRGQNSLLQEQKGGVPPLPSESVFSLTNIERIEELIEIFKLLPADPKIYGLLVSSCLQYKLYDKAIKDEFRHPITSLRSGWADCDDFAVINYFWAFLHKFNPNMTVITNNRDESHHVFVWYRDRQNNFVVMDNSGVLVLTPDYSVEKYIENFSSDYAGTKKGDSFTINYNGPV